MKRLLFLAFAALALAACGGGDGRLSQGQYEAKLKSTFSAAAAELSPASHKTDSAALLQRIAKSYDGIASALDGLRVPTNVQRLNDRLASAASAKAQSLKELVSKLNGASQAERQRLLAQYNPDFAAFDSAVAALEARGYRFRTSAGT